MKSVAMIFYKSAQKNHSFLSNLTKMYIKRDGSNTASASFIDLGIVFYFVNIMFSFLKITFLYLFSTVSKIIPKIPQDIISPAPTVSIK